MTKSDLHTCIRRRCHTTHMPAYTRMRHLKPATATQPSVCQAAGIALALRRDRAPPWVPNQMGRNTQQTLPPAGVQPHTQPPNTHHGEWHHLRPPAAATDQQAHTCARRLRQPPGYHLQPTARYRLTPSRCARDATALPMYVLPAARKKHSLDTCTPPHSSGASHPPHQHGHSTQQHAARCPA
jgi:hypothetical protein